MIGMIYRFGIRMKEAGDIMNCPAIRNFGYAVLGLVKDRPIVRINT